jgi:AAA family ATP:ADP antiporter
MKSRRFWLKILNVYPHEWKVVRRLYLFQFLQGAGLAFFFTSAFAQFLEKFPITELPWVMVYSALLLWLIGWMYTKLEHALKFRQFNLGIILLMATSILLLWVANFQLAGEWFLYVLMAWFNVLYLLNNLQFWGIAALLFDLRQSKRLFAVISAGDIPAKFIGYTLALIFVPYTGAQNLLLLGAGCIVASIPLFSRIVAAGHLDTPHHAHKKPHAKTHVKDIGKLVSNIATNTYIRRIAFISLLTSICVILINYGFYGEVRKAYHDDVELARFIAFFYATLRVVAFVTKMVFTSRFTASWGVRQALFITPVGMLLLVGLIVTTSGFSPGQQLVFYLFGVASMLVDVLRTSFNSPVLLTLMQPLPTYERLRAHNIVKGIMDPFASFLSGAFLLILFYMHNRVDLVFLCYVLLTLGLLWLIGVVLVNRQYLHILVRTISSRYFSREEFDLNNEDIQQQIRKKMMKGSELEVISILRMLSSKMDAVSEELIAELLNHRAPQVQIEALRMINSSTPNIREKLENLIAGETEAEVKAEAVKSYCKIGEAHWSIQSYFSSGDPSIRDAAITGMLRNPDPALKQLAEDALAVMMKSEETFDRRTALSILTQVRNEYDHPVHAWLIADEDEAIRKSAISAIGKAASKETLTALAGQFDRGLEKQIITAFHEAGDRSVYILQSVIGNPAIPGERCTKLIALLGKIGGDKAKKVLLELLETEVRFTGVIVKALHRCHYYAIGEPKKRLEEIARVYLVHAVDLLHMQRGLGRKDEQYHVLNNSLNYELHEIREILLCIFGCLYDREQINKARNGMNAKQKDSFANALEIIELTVKKDIGRNFNTLYETADVIQRCNALRALFTEKEYGPVEEILGRILAEKPIHYYSWTKACSMYIAKKYLHPLDSNLYKKYIQSENRLLKETALFATATP